MRELNRASLPEVMADPEQPALKVTVTLNPDSYQSLMNELYDGCLVEAWAKQQRKDESKVVIPPLRTETKAEVDKKTGKTRTVAYHVYEDVSPAGPFFKTAPFGNLADKKGLLKLWRDAVWGTVRGIPTTRNPYKERAEDPKKDARGSGVSELWGALLKEQSLRKRNKLHTISVASSIWLGAQDHNAEYVAFRGSPSETLLLHFWNVVMQVFVPQAVERDKKTRDVRVTTGEGYILAIPDVSDLKSFKEDFAQVMAALQDDATRFRPPDSVVCVPQEGALQLLSRLAARAKGRSAGRLRYSVSAIEVFHLHKPGNTVMTLATDRLVVDDETLTDYERVHRKTHPLLRAHLIRALLRSEPWYRGFNRLAARTDAEWLVGHAGASWSTAQFCGDARKLIGVDVQSARKGDEDE
jgi:CRISPR-associated protein Cmx8